MKLNFEKYSEDEWSTLQCDQDFLKKLAKVLEVNSGFHWLEWN